MAVCETLIGPPEQIAGVAGVAKKAPYNWRRLGARFRAVGDLPSAVHMRALLAHSDAHQLGLTAEHLVRGASEAEIAAILQARADAPDRRPDPELLPDFVSSRVAAE